MSASSSVFEPARRVASTNSHLLPLHWSHLDPSLAPLRVSMTCCSAARLGCTASSGLASATRCSAVFGWCGAGVGSSLAVTSRRSASTRPSPLVYDSERRKASLPALRTELTSNLAMLRR